MMALSVRRYVKREPCPGHGRHWFAVYGRPGLRAPYCQRCGAPNPRDLTADEMAEFEHERDQPRSMVRTPGGPAEARAHD